MLNLFDKAQERVMLKVTIKILPSTTEKQKDLSQKRTPFYVYRYIYITRFFRSSHPKPPAPMTRTLHVSNKNWSDCKE
jgi:hypothetical protein